MFRTIPLSIIRSFSLYTQNGICHTGLLPACEQEHLLLLASWQQTCMTYTILCVQWKTPDDGKRNCPKHVEFHSKLKFWEISASSWFCYKKFITMRGHVSVKNVIFSSVNFLLSLSEVDGIHNCKPDVQVTVLYIVLLLLKQTFIHFCFLLLILYFCCCFS